MKISDIQAVLASARLYDGSLDGRLGPASRAAMAASGVSRGQGWTLTRWGIAAVQMVLDRHGFAPGAIDGLRGKKTDQALAAWRIAPRFAHCPEGVVSCALSSAAVPVPAVPVPAVPVPAVPVPAVPVPAVPVPPVPVPAPEPVADPLGDYTGPATRLADIDLPRLGAMIGVGEDELHAVLDVETRGGGFDQRRRPKMLFEPHVFWRELGAGTARDAAEAQGLAYPRWGTARYPNDSYPRLRDAVRISRDAALRSASWGLGQIMGFNADQAGYDSAEQMVLAFIAGGEAEHLAAMIRFIAAAGLDDELRAHNWAAFARGYNGAGYATHGYHIKLAERFAWWQRIPDTPFEVDRMDINWNDPAGSA